MVSHQKPDATFLTGDYIAPIDPIVILVTCLSLQVCFACLTQNIGTLYIVS
ncbi:hypothetical protein DAI22_01g288300 [Oryza sativa Japonica Group]|nr:hypothetical protein DAI22_01g288300 [Oryza sativa Japonica Group]